MNYQSEHSNPVRDNSKPGSFMSLKDYLAADNVSTNPYASIDDFLDETWNLDVSSSGDRSHLRPKNPNL